MLPVSTLGALRATFVRSSWPRRSYTSAPDCPIPWQFDWGKNGQISAYRVDEDTHCAHTPSRVFGANDETISLPVVFTSITSIEMQDLEWLRTFCFSCRRVHASTFPIHQWRRSADRTALAMKHFTAIPTVQSATARSM